MRYVGEKEIAAVQPPVRNQLRLLWGGASPHEQVECLLTAGIDVSLTQVDSEQGVSERRQIPLVLLR